MGPSKSPQYPTSGFQTAFLIGLLPNAFIVFASMLGLGEAFLNCVGGRYPCSKVVSDTIEFVRVIALVYAAMGLILGFKRSTQVLPIAAGLGLPTLLGAILVNIQLINSGIQLVRSAVPEWIIVNALVFGVPPIAAFIGAIVGARLKSSKNARSTQ